MSNAPELIACHQCGHTMPKDGGHHWCPLCYGVGHMFRMMTRDEMTEYARDNNDAGLVDLAGRIAHIIERVWGPQ